MGTFFNSIIDNFLAVGLRITELPLFLLLPAIVIIFILLSWGRRRMSLHSLPWAKTLNLARILFVLAAAALLVDLKIFGLVRENRDLRARTDTNISGLLDLLEVTRDQPLWDARDAQDKLEKYFQGAKILSLKYSDYADIAFIRFEEPLVVLFLAVIDLEFPGLEVVVDDEIGKKWLTSDFATQNGCSLAVNGEAGRGPRLDSGLGKYTGNLICRGNPILLKDNHKRPFLSFNRENQAQFYPQKIIDRELSPDKYNVIWGRFDCLVNGKVPPKIRTKRWHGPMPSNVMGINKEGTKLYLLIADGRQPGYSMGLTVKEGGMVMLACGAYNAMACDAGGSACIYAETFGGIINFPCDGEERPTYTHFGIRFLD